eukprot:2373564-Rhodomonas_salina.2
MSWKFSLELEFELAFAGTTPRNRIEENGFLRGTCGSEGRLSGEIGGGEGRVRRRVQGDRGRGRRSVRSSIR